MMKEIALVIVLLALCIPALAVDMPNMVGNWTGTAHGVKWLKNTDYQTTGKANFWDYKYTIAINEQKETRFSGKMTFDANPLATEVVLGVIGSDNKTINLVDESGYYLGIMKSPTEMELFGSVVDMGFMNVGVGTFTKE